MEVKKIIGISPFSSAQKISLEKALASSIKKVLKEAEKQIRKINPNIVGGEARSFLTVHQAGREKRDRAKPITIGQLKGRSTCSPTTRYYTADLARPVFFKALYSQGAIGAGTDHKPFFLMRAACCSAAKLLSEEYLVKCQAMPSSTIL